jgi:hypothetical protein
MSLNVQDIENGSKSLSNRGNMFINEYDLHLAQLTGYSYNIQGIHTLWLHLHIRLARMYHMTRSIDHSVDIQC